MTTAIKFVSVSKKYTLHKHRSRSIQELFLNGFKRQKSRAEVFWVLNDVSFSVKQGESLALIGPNGAGKSTILKLLSSIIAPTSGKIEINGSISSLLELGAGFHPDLTGRENIYLNGSILGLSRVRIDSKYGAIVDFADIEEYIDLPVKHYSSGMYLRLAFAVASHLDPDILLIDEVIAVGDYIFQQRCLKRLAQLKASGVTLVLVSHTTGLLEKYCERGIWLENGRIQADGNIERVIEAYLAAQYQRYVIQRVKLPKRVSLEDFQALTQAGVQVDRWGSGDVEITKVELLNHLDEPQTTFHVGESFTVRMNYHASTLIKDPVFGIAIHQANGIQVNGPNTKENGYTIDAIYGKGYVDYTIEALNLLPQSYELSVAVYDTQGLQAYDHQHRNYRFQILPGQVFERRGITYLPSRWNHISDPYCNQDKVVDSEKTVVEDR